MFDSILEEACIKSGAWMLNCDKQENAELKILVLDILHFTTLLIEHTYSRDLYNSIEYLTMLLQSSDVHIVLGVLSIVYVFNKRSNFITRLQLDKKQALIERITFLAETWGGRKYGFNLARCCTVRNPSDFPEHATNLHFAYTVPSESSSSINNPTIQTPKQIEIPNVHLAGPNAAAVMEIALAQHTLPEDKQMKLFIHLRLAYAFPSFDQRLLCIQARLQALSILVYSGAIQETNNILYDGLIKELVDVFYVQDSTLTDVKASALKTLTSIIHFEQTTKHRSRLQEIIKATQVNSYHGFLPALVRQCIDKLTDDSNERFPQSLSTALFSFLYHLASHEKGAIALVNCGVMQSLIKVVNYYDESQDSIMFVTRAVRIIDLITTLDMTSFQTNNGLEALINRLEHEIAQCRKEQSFIIRIPKRNQGTPTANLDTHPPLCPSTQLDISGEHLSVTTQNSTAHLSKDMDTSEFIEENHDLILQNPIPGLTCYHQRAALLKAILNFLKKAFTEPTMADTTRHIMDSSLPNSLKHIISNVEYYGPSLFHLATDIVTSFIFQEPSQLSSLQDNGLTDVLMHALFKKDIPAARDVLASLPNIFSSLCLNARGLENFMEYKPFHKFFRIFLISKYLPTMIRRRGTIYGTASSLGTAVNKFIIQHVSLRTEVMKSIITLLEQLVELGNNPQYSCQKPESLPLTITNRNVEENNRDSSVDEDDDEDDKTLSNENKSEDETVSVAVPLLDYLKNIMRFFEGVISNNTTDDHGKEFVKLGGLKSLLDILQMKNLPVDFPSSKACHCVAALCKSTFTFLLNDDQLIEIIIPNLDTILDILIDFCSNRRYDDLLLNIKKIDKIDFKSSPLSILLLMFEHPMLNKNIQLIDKLFKLLSLISQSIPTNKKLVILDSYINLVSKILISKSYTQDGLEFAIIFLLNISKINQVTRNKILHLLVNHIGLLAKGVSEDIKQLLREVENYLSQKKSNIPITTNDQLYDSYKNIRSNSITFMDIDSNAKQQDLQLPTMIVLTSKNANQQFLLRILKVIIQLLEATKKEQLDARTHFETDVDKLTHLLDTLRQSSRSHFPLDNNSTNQQNDILQPTDELANCLEQIRTRLHTILNSNTIEQRQQIFYQQDIYNLIRQFESLIKDFPQPPLSTIMITGINDFLQINPPLTPQIYEPMDLGQFLPNQQSKLSDLLNMNQLWDSLNDCLLSLAKLSDPQAVLVLQPTVEAFFLVHTADLDNENEKQKKKKKDREQREALSHLEWFSSAPTTTTSTNELPLDAQKFVKFARTHRMLLNQIVRRSTQHLSEGPFHILTDYTFILHFDIKRKYFRHELDRLKENIHGEHLAVHVRHNHVFEDSFRELSRRTPEDWKHRFYIVFDDKKGQDPDGRLREWYSLITRSMFDSNYALFMIIPGDRLTYTPSPSSHINTCHLKYFKFIGRIIAKAIFDNKYMNCYFTRSFYKHILGIPICYTDMESVDLQFYKNLVMLLQNDIEQLGLDLTFSLDASEFGENKVIDLLPNGSRIVVTNENKHEFVRLVCQERLIGCIKQQINSFLDGFYDIIPKSLISIFNEQELELLISG
ncbi:unnamed protein product [Adineta steineri]|uniref:HECT-type E3 ubiquitin transferase n=4 Tax=Adineta steineri TaxID=433720 RepID=A0A813RUB0_9BILA|nr:unnamed protein product [Adineta steineri]